MHNDDGVLVHGEVLRYWNILQVKQQYKILFSFLITGRVLVVLQWINSFQLQVFRTMFLTKGNFTVFCIVPKNCANFHNFQFKKTERQFQSKLFHQFLKYFLLFSKRRKDQKEPPVGQTPMTRPYPCFPIVMLQDVKVMISWKSLVYS